MGLTDCNIWICDNCSTEARTSGVYKERFPEGWFILNKRTIYKPSGYSALDMLSWINWKHTEYFCSFTCLLQTYTKED